MQNLQALISPEASIMHALADPVPTSIPTVYHKNQLMSTGEKNRSVKRSRNVSRVTLEYKLNKKMEENLLKWST